MNNLRLSEAKILARVSQLLGKGAKNQAIQGPSLIHCTLLTFMRGAEIFHEWIWSALQALLRRWSTILSPPFWKDYIQKIAKIRIFLNCLSLFMKQTNILPENEKEWVIWWQCCFILRKDRPLWDAGYTSEIICPSRWKILNKSACDQHLGGASSLFPQLTLQFLSLSNLSWGLNIWGLLMS